MVKKLLCFLFFSLSFLISAQNSNLKITLTGTAETCLSNGSLSWTISGESAGATVVYSIYNNAVSTVNTTTTSTMLSGLPSGTYRVVATETFGSQSSQATSNNFTITDSKVAVQFRTKVINEEICGNDGSFQVYVTSGRKPYRFQLLNAADNSVIRDQASDTFTDLTKGNYKYRVIDGCGNGFTGQQEILYEPSKLQSAHVTARPVGCDQLDLMIFNFSGSLKYPLKITAVFTNPVTLQKEEITKANILKGKERLLIPFFPSEAFLDLDVTIEDACNKIFQLPTKTIDQSISHQVTTRNEACGSKSIMFFPKQYSENDIEGPYRINFTSYPTGFDPVALNSKHGELASTHNYGINTVARVPFGTYNYEVYDDCGRKTIGTFQIDKTPFKFNNQGITEVCGTGLYNGRVLPSQGYTIAEARITQAPQEFIDRNGPLPFQIPATWYYNQLTSILGRYF